jgi:hypothetical protein
MSITTLTLLSQIEPISIEKVVNRENRYDYYREENRINYKLGNSGEIYLLPDNKLVYTLTGNYRLVDLSPTGKYIIFIEGNSRTYHLVETSLRKEISIFKPNGEIIKNLERASFSQTEKFIIFPDDNDYGYQTSMVFDLQTGLNKEKIKLAKVKQPFLYNDKFAICDNRIDIDFHYERNRKIPFYVYDIDKDTLSFEITGDIKFYSNNEKLIVTTTSVYDVLKRSIILNQSIDKFSDNLNFGFSKGSIFDLSTGKLFYDFGNFYIIESISDTKIVTTYQGIETHIFELERIKVYSNYKSEIQIEFSQIKPKDEFETQIEFNNRYVAEKNNIMTKYENIYSENNKLLVKKIKESYTQIELKIDVIGQYDPERQEFPITINEKTIAVKIPLSEARSFKENCKNAKVTATKQLDEVGNNFNIFNIKIAHPQTGSIYAFGEQKKALFIEEDSGGNSAESGVPKLEIIAKLVEPSGNNLIDGNENSYIEVSLKNSGNGSAKDVRINMEGNSAEGIKFDKAQKITGIAPGQNQNVKMNIEADRALKDGSVEFNINVTEWKGFNPNPIKLIVNTQEFKKPNLVYIESGIKELMGNSNNIIENNEIIEVSALIQNKGQGVSDETQVLFAINDPNIITTTPAKLNQKIGSINPGESKTITFAFTVNNEYNGDNSLPIDVLLSERFNSYGGKFPIRLDLKKVSLATQNIKIEGEYSKDKVISEASLTSDIDKNIPEDSLKNNQRYALIIGNENYSKYQTGLNSESNVDFAVNDALAFSKYAEKTIGVPKENITLLIDATSSKMKSEIERICKIATYSNGQAEILFYYAGHGLPDEITKEGYVIPVDVTGSNVKDGIMLTKLYQQLTESPVKKVTIFLDACFSGGGRNAGLFAARGVKVKPKEELIKGNLVVFSASSGDQTSLPYKEKAHGMFTYFLLKKIQETKGNINYKDLAEYIKSEVQLNSVKINSKDQNPEILFNPQIEGEWENWNLK